MSSMEQGYDDYVNPKHLSRAKYHEYFASEIDFCGSEWLFGALHGYHITHGCAFPNPSKRVLALVQTHGSVKDEAMYVPKKHVLNEHYMHAIMPPETPFKVQRDGYEEWFGVGISNELHGSGVGSAQLYGAPIGPMHVENPALSHEVAELRKLVEELHDRVVESERLAANTRATQRRELKA